MALLDNVMKGGLPAMGSLRLGSLTKLSPIELVGAVLLVGLGIYYVIAENDSFFNFWTDRDMVRSEMLLREFQWMGAELSYGSAARVPGGFLHYLWVLPTLISKDPQLSYQFCVLLGMLALIPFYLALRNTFGVVTAVSGTMVLLASPILFGTLMRLWNPSFQAPFIILAFAFLVRVLGEQHMPSFKWLVGSLALGMQMHLSTYLLIICIVLAMVILRTRIPRREVLLSIGIVLLLLAPYLIGEIMTGFDNLRQMVSSQGKGALREYSLTKGMLYNPDNVGDVWRWYMLAFDMNDNLPASPLRSFASFALNLAILIGGAYFLLAVAYWLEWGKPIARALDVKVNGAHGRVILAAFLPVLLGFLYFSYSPQVDLVVFGSARYLMFAIPGLAIIAGLGVGALYDLGRKSPALQMALLVPIAIAVAMPAYALATSIRALDKPWNQPGRDFMGSLDQVMRELDLNLTETVARTVVLRRFDEPANQWRFESVFGIGYELHRNKLTVPFSRKGECVAYATDGIRIHGDKGMSLETLRRSFQQPGLDIQIVRQIPLAHDIIVVYTRNGGNGYCFTSVQNRYVFSEEEKLMHDVYYGKVPEGTALVRPTSDPRKESIYIANIGQGIYGLFKFQQAGGGKLTLEFHSNQLRGDTYNGGFLEIGMIADPRLRFTNERGEATLVTIENGLVGGKGTFTPLRQEHSVPPGRYEIELEAEVYPPVKLTQWPVDFNDKKPVKIRIAKDFTVWP